MTLTTTFKVGGLVCHTLEGGKQHLDGGAMFGVVPRTLWEREIPPDARHRIPLALRCMLVEHNDGLVLIDTGLGNKENDKFKQIYGVENTGTQGPTQLEDALAELKFTPSDIGHVINTHLHFDHAGGNTMTEGGVVRPSFPKASYVVQKREVEFATHTNERTAASYLPHNWEPVIAAGKFQFVDGETDVLRGIRVLPTPGHVPFHQSVLVTDRGESACFLADLVPTASHLPLPWIMGYDVEPLVTLESKRTTLTKAEAEGWILVFEHDPTRGLGRVVKDSKAFRYAPVDTPSRPA